MGLFGGINAVNEINSLIAQIERNMNALAPMIELNGMKHTTQSKELTKLVRRDLDRIKDLLNQLSSASIARSNQLFDPLLLPACQLTRIV